jgi:hypothetical protein
MLVLQTTPEYQRSEILLAGLLCFLVLLGRMYIVQDPKITMSWILITVFLFTMWYGMSIYMVRFFSIQ